jgi:hypothetical protein
MDHNLLVRISLLLQPVTCQLQSYKFGLEDGNVVAQMSGHLVLQDTITIETGSAAGQTLHQGAVSEHCYLCFDWFAFRKAFHIEFVSPFPLRWD